MNIALGEKYHRQLYFLSLMGIAFGLSVSKVVISLSTMLLIVNWIWEGGFAAKWRLLLARKSVFILIAVFALHLPSLLWTSDVHEGLNDIRIKLPLLIIPLILGMSAPLTRPQFETTLVMFGIGVLIASFRTYLIVRGVIHKEFTDIREASDLVPLIRLALFSALTIMFCGRWFMRTQNLPVRILCIAVSAWLFYFMVFMQSLTGLVVLLASTVLIAVIMAALNRRKKALIGMLAVIAGVLCVAGFYVKRAYDDFYLLRGNEIPELLVTSPNGHHYFQNLDVPMYENGNKVMVNLCWVEMERGWNKRSNIPFYGGRDGRGNFVRTTLPRYMASKGLIKDSVGMEQLTPADIRAIEDGVTNYKEFERNPLENRAYQVFWELYNYSAGGNPSGSSITMRFVVIGAAWHAISEHPWLGTGVGSQKNTYDAYYTSNGTRLDEKWQWLHAHNQFLSFAVTLGVPVMLYFIFALWWPARNMRRWRSYLYLAFFIIVVLSFLDDDTLETQQGVTFFAFFNCLLLYAMPFVSSVTNPKEKISSPEDPT
jgi:O-antigen ligase